MNLTFASIHKIVKICCSAKFCKYAKCFLWVFESSKFCKCLSDKSFYVKTHILYQLNILPYSDQIPKTSKIHQIYTRLAKLAFTQIQIVIILAKLTFAQVSTQKQVSCICICTSTCHFKNYSPIFHLINLYPSRHCS